MALFLFHSGILVNVQTTAIHGGVNMQLNTRSARLPIVTSTGHTSRALDFYKKTNVYFGYGKQDEWADEANPDAPDPTQTQLFSPLGYKKVTRKLLVVPDPLGTIQYADRNWKQVTEAEARTQMSRWVYLETTLNWDELPLTEYRQIGLLVDLVPKAGITSYALLPSEVQDTGLLVLIYNRTRVLRQNDQKDLYSIILEF